MWRLRRSVRRKIGRVFLMTAIGCVMLAIGAVLAKHRTEGVYGSLLAEKSNRISAAERLVCITTKEVKAGEVFTAENTEQKFLLAEQAPETLALDVLGMVACADLQPGVILNTALCSRKEFSDTVRECVFDDIERVKNFGDCEVVDVRIRYPNGENYCVLRKKLMRKVEEDAEECNFWLTEAEQLMISAAQYDAEVYDGTMLYVVGFLEERLQQEAGSDYIPSRQVILEMQQSDLNNATLTEWYELRCALEERLFNNRKERAENRF